MKIIPRLIVPALVAFTTLFAHSSEAKPLRVMTFNTMCDFCGNKKETGKFKDRLKAIGDTINRHNPDLISLQEVRTLRQVKKIQSYLKDQYTAVYARGKILHYTDATLLIRKSRFNVLQDGGFWLGPNPKNWIFGWKIAYPRRLEWADVQDKETGEQFKFVGSHFDNATKNKEPTAKLVTNTFKDSKIPVLFGGDTNLWPVLNGYSVLTDTFRDSFQEVSEHRYYSNGPTINSDGCNLHKAEVFPDCRVDHVLMSRHAPWKVKTWGVDTYKYYGTLGFVSDHRAVIVDLE